MTAASRLIAFRVFRMRAHAGFLVARSAIEPVDHHLLTWAHQVLRGCFDTPSQENPS